MMHGRGKSDAAIVAEKPTNKAERSAAEPVEPRAEAKGNASQQSTQPGAAPGKRVTGAGAHTIRREAVSRLDPRQEPCAACDHDRDRTTGKIASVRSKATSAPPGFE